MAWNIAGVGRRTRDAATEAARRSGMRLDDWLDEAIADYVGLDQADRPERDEARTIGWTRPPDASNASRDEMRHHRRRAFPESRTPSRL